nr:protein KIAA0100 [Leptinotarsa decemlineata]
MGGFIIFLIIICVLFLTVSWILPMIISWHFQRKYDVSLKIKKIGMPYLKLCDISLSKNGFSIHVDEISIKSSFLNSELTKLVTLVVRDVRINKDLSSKNVDESTKYSPQTKSDIDFRDNKVPHFITSFAQFMAVHVYNISAMLLRSETPGYLIHATASELHLDGSILKNAKSLLATINLMDAEMKILRHAEQEVKETKLAEFSFGISMETILVAQGPLSVEKLDINMSHSRAVINGGFYNLAQSSKSEKIPKMSRYNSSSCEDDIFERLKPIIPKKCSLYIDETSLTGVKDDSQIEYSSSLKSLALNCRSVPIDDKVVSDDSSVLFNFYMSDLFLQNSKEKLLELKHLNIDAKLIQNSLNIYLQQNCLLVTYDHNLIYKWVSTNFPRSHQEISPMILEDTEKRRDRLRIYRSSAFEKIIEKLNISFCAELFQVLAVIRLKNQDSSIGFNRVRLMLDQSPEKRGSTFKAYIPNLFLRDRHWAMEFSVDSLWWSFKEWNQDTNVSKVTHIWGTPLYLGMGVIKLSTSANQEVRLESLLDTIQLEWSLEFADYVLLALRCFKQYGSIKPKHSSPKKEIGDRDLQNLSCHLVVTHFNLFMQAQNIEYFVSRINTISLDKTIDEVRKSANAVNVKFEGFKIFSLNSNGDGYTCIQTEDISNYKVFINTALLEVRNLEEKPKETTLTLLETVETHWSTNFHLKSLLLVRDVMEFLSGVKKELDIVDGGAVKQKCFNTLNIFGKFEFHIEISPSHNAKIALVFLNTSLLISIDEQKIFTLKGIDVHRIKSHPVIEAERNDAGSFNLKFNKTYGIFIDLFTAVFPHEHNFAEAIQNQLVSVFKWLKIIHNIKKDKTIPQSLPGDLLINVKEFLFEMSDDPFEVKLRDNFELLEDEYNESLKRQKMLRDKIGDLLKTHLHMPAGKVEELYATLKKKNAEIYVQRSKLMYKASPQRTRLFAWSMANLELLILADPSIHGPERVINVMREIDSASPWPEEPMEFSTLWCRVISFRCAEWKFQLRDFPQPLMHIKKCYICGQLVGAEQVAPKRAIRTVEVHLGEPFEPVVIERGMLPLKFYHDFNCEVEYFSYAFGPCWEPVIAQCNLSFNQISAPSRDPSPVLTFWDKMRLLLHGRLTMVVEQLTVLLHASLDPYNTTEEMALTWEKVIMDWTNAKFVYKGDLNIFVRTASKYDDVQLLKMPNLKLILGINWVCLGHPNDHHSVIQCAPDKVPEYSSNQVHDSFRAFRSQNVNLSIVLETRPVPNEPNNCPILLLYGSTLRWIESLKLILSGVTRPTKRGRIFNNVRPRKIQLSRHYKKVHLLIGLHKFQVCYWMSFSMQRGSELFGGRLSSSSEHTLSLVNIDDGLKHRPKAEWSVVYMNSELSDFEMWLKSALHDEQDVEVPTPRQPVEKCFCLSVAKVSYGRETVVPSQERNKDIPTHRLVVHDLRGAWTKSNRNVAFALFDTFMKTTRLKKNLSTEALKGFRKENTTTPLKRRNTDPSCTPPNASIQAIQSSTAVQDTPSPMTKLQSGHAANMLQQLIAEADNNAVVYSDDLSAVSKQHLQGLQACQQDDVQHKNWQIALVNAQVLLKGCETKGYVILSAAKAEIVQRIHRPAWKDRTLVSKTTWLGTLECMQYYATVNARENDTTDDNIMWLTVDNIQEKESTEISEPSEVPNMVGSGVSVGAVVSDTVGPSCSRQLQRIVSRCKCEFFYADYGDISVDPKGLGEIPPPPQEEVGPWESRESAVDAFTLMHYDLEVCTNSLQYAMLLDIVNNLLLYVEPHRKEALEKLARMRFKLQLHSVEDQRKPIQNQQTLVRSTQSKLKRLEKETYLVNKALEESPDDIGLRQDAGRLERLMDECKNQLSAQSEELDMMLSCYKESQLLANARLATTRSDKPLTIVRANEICFKHAQWRLTEADGQIGIADLVLSNFLYTKNSKSDDSVEHLLELGYMRMTNLLPNEIYKEVLCPTEIQFDMPIEHKKVLRIFCREKPPVGGISVKEIFEINLVPLTLGHRKKSQGAKSVKFNCIVFIIIFLKAIKQKLQIKRNTGSSNESTTPQEEDKARMLFGARHAPENRSIRKGVSGVFRFGK